MCNTGPVVRQTKASETRTECYKEERGQSQIGADTGTLFNNYNNSIQTVWQVKPHMYVYIINHIFHQHTHVHELYFTVYPAHVVCYLYVCTTTAHPPLENVPIYILYMACLLYTSPSPRDRQKSRMPSSA